MKLFKRIKERDALACITASSVTDLFYIIRKETHDTERTYYGGGLLIGNDHERIHHGRKQPAEDARDVAVPVKGVSADQESACQNRQKSAEPERGQLFPEQERGQRHYDHRAAVVKKRRDADPDPCVSLIEEKPARAPALLLQAKYEAGLFCFPAFPVSERLPFLA